MNKVEIFNCLKECIVDVLLDVDENDIKIEQSLKDLGANSIDRMDITIDCMKATGIKIPPQKLGNISNIQELVDAFYEESRSK